jgi:hypothetical protein
VVRDALAGTDAMGMWDSDEHLAVNFGKWKVQVREEGVPGSTFQMFESFLRDYRGSSGRLHLTQSMTKRMASQVILPEVFCGVVEHGLRQDVQLSMMSGSHKGPIHCDAEDALLMQFDGSKTVYLADPGYFKALDVKRGSARRRASHNVAVSDVDFWKVDERAHPGFARVRWLRVEVQAGDMLYIPAFWFHAIQSEGARNLVVNHWFAQETYNDVLGLVDGDPVVGEGEGEGEGDCCEECWPCKIRTFCRNTLGTNPKFPACKQTLEMDGVLTPGFKMDEAAGIFSGKEQELWAEGKDRGRGAGGGGNPNLDGEDVVRLGAEPDFAMHTPPAPGWEDGEEFGYDVEAKGDEDVADSDEELVEQKVGGDKDYDGSGSRDGFV